MVGASGAAAGPSLLETMIEVASGPGRRAALPRPVGTPRRAYVSRCGPTAPACAVPIGPPYLVQAPALISASSCRRSFLARGLLASHFLLRSFIGSSSSPASQQVKTASASQNSLVNIHHVSCNLVNPIHCRGRDGDRPPPTARIPASGTTAPGSGSKSALQGRPPPRLRRQTAAIPGNLSAP